MTLTGGRVFFRKTELYKTLTAPPEPDARYPRFVNVPQNEFGTLAIRSIESDGVLRSALAAQSNGHRAER